jgi:hypothetical protein
MKQRKSGVQYFTEEEKEILKVSTVHTQYKPSHMSLYLYRSRQRH